jgi:hypothetical protein
MEDSKLTVVMPRQTRYKLKAVLALRGLTMTSWINGLAEKEIVGGREEQELAVEPAEVGHT